MEAIAEIVVAKSPPAVARTKSSLLRSSDAEFVKFVDDTNSKWLEADSLNRARLFDNLRAFFAIYGGQWDKQALADLEAQGRHPVTFNVAEQKLRTLAGSIQSEKFDFDFLPMDMVDSTLIRGIKYWYYADKEQYNYAATDARTLIRGLVQVGIDEIDVRYDVRPEGAITFTSTLPGQVLKDPYWQTDDQKDWERAIKHGWFTAQEIIDKYHTDDEAIQKQATRDSLGGEIYEQIGMVDVHEDVNPTWGSKYLVIEYRWMEKLSTTRLIGCRPDGKLIPFPVEVKDRETVQLYMKVNGIEKFSDLKEVPYEDKILYLSAVCPQLSGQAILTKGRHYIQCGSIGFFSFSACHEMGIDKGVMDAVIDLQRTLNFREMKKDDVIASAASGAVLVDKSKLDNPQRDMEDLKRNKTRPDYVLGVNGDPNAIVARIPTGEVPQSIWNDIAGLIDMFDRVSPVTPALEGKGGGDESGVLFEMRHAVTKLGTLILYDNWLQHQADKAEAWYYQAQIQHKGMYKKVKDLDTGSWVEFNSPQYPNGDPSEKAYLNRIEDLPRARVIVTLSKSSPSEQYAKRGMLYDMTKIYSAHPDLFKPQIHIVTNQMIDTLDLSPQEKMQHKIISSLQAKVDVMELIGQAANISAGTMNAQVMMKQAQAMLAGPQGPQGGQQNALGIPQGEEPAQALSYESDQTKVPMPEENPNQYLQVPNEEIDKGNIRPQGEA